MSDQPTSEQLRSLARLGDAVSGKLRGAAAADRLLSPASSARFQAMLKLVPMPPKGSGITQDWNSNVGRPHIQIFLVLFRIARRARSKGSRPALTASKAAGAVYRAIGLGLLGIDIPVSTEIGPNFAIHHGQGLVIHNRSILGAGVTIRQCTTLGTRDGEGGAPMIGDGVDVGSNVVVLGPVLVGAGSRIGAGSVVIKDVPAGATVVGNPAREIV